MTDSIFNFSKTIVEGLALALVLTGCSMDRKVIVTDSSDADNTYSENFQTVTNNDAEYQGVTEQDNEEEESDYVVLEQDDSISGDYSDDDQSEEKYPDEDSLGNVDNLQAMREVDAQNDAKSDATAEVKQPGQNSLTDNGSTNNANVQNSTNQNANKPDNVNPSNEASKSDEGKADYSCQHTCTRTEVIVPGNCAVREISISVCEACGELVENYITGDFKPGIHSGYKATTVVPAHAGNDGYATYTCSCGDSYDVVIPAITSGTVNRNGVSHQFDIYQIDIGNGEYEAVCGFYDYEMASEIIRLLNEYRVSNDKCELTTDSTLNDCAILRGVEGAYYFSHTRPNGSAWSSVNGMSGENLFMGPDFVDAEYAISAWQNSPGHNSNMLGSYSRVAVSCFCRVEFTEDNTPYVASVVCVQCFWR